MSEASHEYSAHPPAFRIENVPAYLAVMGATVLAGLVASALGYATLPTWPRQEATASALKEEVRRWVLALQA